MAYALTDAKESEEDVDVFQVDRETGCVIHPHSAKRIAWDLSSLTMVVYDMIMIPMTGVFLDGGIFLDTMDWVTRLFWTCDIGFSCLTGVVLADGTVMFEL